MSLTHFNQEGFAQMVSVNEKQETLRIAVARGSIYVNSETFERIKSGGVHKGDVITVAQIAGLMGAKKTSELIPMCHPLYITGADLKFDLDEVHHQIKIEATVKTIAKTGVEMEALTAVSVAALTIYDMCKAMDKAMVIGPIFLEEKQGGTSGHYKRGEHHEG